MTFLINLLDDNQDQAYSIVRAKFGSIRVHTEFNAEIERMILENLNEVSSALALESIRINLESKFSHLTVNVRHNAIYQQSRAISEQILADFMDRIGDFVSTVFVYNDDEERKINLHEVNDFLRGLHVEMNIRHNDTLFKILYPNN